MPQSNGVKSWSYSRYGDYRKCPARFRFKHLLKVPEPPAPALARGGAVDEAVTAYLDGKKRTAPTTVRYEFGGESMTHTLNYGPVRAELAALRKAKAATQLELAVDRSWRPTSWRDWDNCWLRAKLDVAARIDGGKVIRIVDNKTGKVYPEDHAEQLEIYAAVAYAHYPEAVEIRAQMFYLDQALVGAPAVFTDLAKTIPKLRKKWEKAVAPLFRDTRFVATPGHQCTWCPYSKKKGGPCEKG